VTPPRAAQRLPRRSAGLDGHDTPTTHRDPHCSQACRTRSTISRPRSPKPAACSAWLLCIPLVDSRTAHVKRRSCTNTRISISATGCRGAGPARPGTVPSVAIRTRARKSVGAASVWPHPSGGWRPRGEGANPQDQGRPPVPAPGVAGSPPGRQSDGPPSPRNRPGLRGNESRHGHAPGVPERPGHTGLGPATMRQPGTGRGGLDLRGGSERFGSPATDEPWRRALVLDPILLPVILNDNDALSVQLPQLLWNDPAAGRHGSLEVRADGCGTVVATRRHVRERWACGHADGSRRPHAGRRGAEVRPLAAEGASPAAQLRGEPGSATRGLQVSGATCGRDGSIGMARRAGSLTPQRGHRGRPNAVFLEGP
jgi:hypothetical protein